MGTEKPVYDLPKVNRFNRADGVRFLNNSLGVFSE